MKRVYKWLAWIVGVPVVGFALLAGAAFWTIHHRDGKFSTLPPGDRQLAIFDAFATAVELNYYDRDFIDHQWPALRDQWRDEAKKSRDDFDVYFRVLLQLTQMLPSSHLSARPPPPASSSGEPVPPRAVPGSGGFDIAIIRRGKSTIGVVDRVQTGTAAASAGIEPGWQVMSYQGCAAGGQVTGIFSAAVPLEKRFDMEAGKTITFTLSEPHVRNAAHLNEKYQRKVTYTCIAYRAGAPFEERDLGGITYVRFDTFMEPGIIDQVLAALERSGSHGAIIDLRSNTGGLRDQTHRLLDKLLPAGALQGTEISRGLTTQVRSDGERVFAGPLAVLIGPTSASAAEVMAAALQDNHRARLFGRPSAGSTLVSNEYLLPDGGKAQVAIADLLRPSGARIEGVGVIPDVGVMPAIEDIRAGRDPALERALLELRKAQTTASTGNRSPAG